MDKGLLDKQPSCNGGPQPGHSRDAHDLACILDRFNPISQQQVISVLKQFVERDGLSLLLVSHDPYLVKHMADEVITVGMN